jgi:DNA polymerase I
VRDEVAIDLEAAGRNPLTDDLIGVSVCREQDKAFYVPLGHSVLAGSSGQMGLGEMAKELSPVLQDQAVFKIGHNLKYELVMLSRNGIPVRGKLFDTMIAAYLLNPNKPNHSLEEVAFEYLSRVKKSFTEIMKKRKSFAEVPVEEAASCAAECAALSYELKDILFRKLKEEGLLDIYNNIEMPLIPVLADMEMAGIKIDTALLNSLSEEVSAEVESIQQRVFFLAGEEFNINSPKQLSTVLFQSLGLTPTKKTKTGFSTGMEVLEDLCEFHELPREVLEYRSLTKLKSTYLDALPLLVNTKTGRLHTSFNQTVTATGRLSSTDPNLQNIPVRGDWGKRIRRAFITEPGNLLISADYSQVELRILAHLSGDNNLINAFREEKDVHTRTAAELFSVSPDQVTPEMRRTAKTVNFGVIYGISSFGLSESLNVDRKDAEKYIKQYFDRHPGVSEYIKNTLKEAKATGFVTTLFGRKRPVPELHSRNRTIQQQGERLAVNSPIQGAAADIIKIAMIRIWQDLRERKLQAKMVLQVHDELLFEAPEPELDTVLQIVKEGMENAVALSVPLRVEIGYGKNWTEAH